MNEKYYEKFKLESVIRYRFYIVILIIRGLSLNWVDSF